MAVGRRGRSRRSGRRADADEPRGARHPPVARGRQAAGGHRLSAMMEVPHLTLRAIRSVGVEVPMTYALGTSRGTITKAPLLLIDLHTEEGVTGRSYLWCYFPAAMPAIATILEEVERTVKG